MLLEQEKRLIVILSPIKICIGVRFNTRDFCNEGMHGQIFPIFGYQTKLHANISMQNQERIVLLTIQPCQWGSWYWKSGGHITLKDP